MIRESFIGVRLRFEDGSEKEIWPGSGRFTWSGPGKRKRVASFYDSDGTITARFGSVIGVELLDEEV